MSNNITTNDTFPSTSGIEWVGGEGSFLVQGTFDSATVDLQWSIDGGTTKTAVGADTTLTATGGSNFQLPPGVQLYVVVSGGGGSLNVNYVLQKSDLRNR